VSHVIRDTDDDGLAISDAASQIAPERPADTVPASVVLTALSIVTAIGFCRVFSGWDFLAPMLFVVIGTHFVALVLRLLKFPGYVAIPIEMIVLFSLLAWKYYPTSLSGPFPTSRTWDFLTSDLQLARDQFPNAVAPVAAIGGFAVIATGAAGLAALLSDAFAFRAYGRAEATVPSAVLFVFASALGVSNHRVAVTAAWLAAALAVIAILRASHAQSEHAWIGRRGRVLLSVLPMAAILAGCAALGGAVIGPRLPGAGQKGLVQTRKRNDVTEVLSPLVDIRSRLINLSNTELFTVHSASPHYWRATGLPRFDGNTWGLPDRDLASVSGSFAQPDPGATQVTQDITISNLGGKLLPAAYDPTGIASSNVYWVSDTGTLVLPDGLSRGAKFEIVSSVDSISRDELLNATSSNPPDPATLALPDDFPASVTAAASEVTAGFNTPYEKMYALEQWFQTTFTYDLSVQKGHGDNAIENFLRVKRGYCEQFSGAFAAMARSLGIPARVAVGFTPGDLGADGLYHVYGRNAHAWPEVWFDNIGWVSFEPTPGRGEPGREGYTGVPAQQAPPAAPDSGSGSAAAPAATTTTVASAAAGPTSTIARPTATTVPKPVVVAKKPASSSTWLYVLAAIAAAAVLWILLMPRMLALLRARRHHKSPLDSIEGAWQRSANALTLLGLGPTSGETPLEHARRAERMSGIDHRTLRELALCATAARYGSIGNEVAAERCEQLSDDVVAAVKSRLPMQIRLATLLDPRRAGLLLAP